MNTKKFSEAMSDVDNKYVDEALNYKRQNKKHWKTWGTIAACLCVVCIGGYALFQSDYGITPKQNEPITNVVDSEGDKRFVQMASILNNNIGGPVTEKAEEIVKIPLGQYTGLYRKITLKDTFVLKYSIGDEIENSPKWYSVSGHTDKQYLIENNDDEYCLWEFKCFDSNSYPYKDVLSVVYHIDSADKIIEVRVNPPISNNTDAGKKLQAEIGSQTITSRDEIQKLYTVISSMTCYGENNWDRINTGSNDVAMDTDNDSLKEIRLGRYLTLVTDYGNEVDGLKYTATSNMFYEFSGIAYSPLKDEQASEMIELLHIKSLDISEDSVNPSNVASELTNEDAAENVSDDTKTHENADISLEYVTELQTQISNAMARGELFFVTSSSVLENPYRLHLVVISDSEDNIKKLESYDTKGGALEIECNPNSIGIEE